jgi:membrane-associated phospholipid phosphatase
MRLPSATLASMLSIMALVSACNDRAAAPTGPGITASRNGNPSAEGLASPAWQTIAGISIKTASAPGVAPIRAAMNPLQAAHAYALVGVAQYLAVQVADAAKGSNGRSNLEAERGAVAGASAAVLTYLFPADAQAFADLVSEQGNAGAGQPHPWFTRGEAIGRGVGATIVARARIDRFGANVNPVVPTGPQYWTINPPPSTALLAGRELPGVTPWFLTSANQFRPGAPPEFGSQDFLNALAEIHTLSVNPTQAHSDIAAYWALNAGTVTAAGFWLQVATNDINARGLSEREATHVYALASAAMFDAAIGCWDAKLNYWLIRPWQTDAAIIPLASVGRPNHPSYPSGHSCVSSSGAEVLSAFFPDEADRLSAMVTEAGLSRMYGGIHYRFDIDAGQALGRNVAHWAIAQDASGNSVLTPH